MRTVPVVLMHPGLEFGLAFGGVLVEASVGPFAQRGLDEAFGLAVGTRGVGARAEMADTELPTSVGELAGVVAGSVVGEDAANGEAQARVVAHGVVQEGDRAAGALVRMQGREGHAGVIIDGDVENLPAGAAGFVAGIAGEAMTGLDDASEFFGVDVQQIAGMSMLVAAHGQDGLQIADAAEFVTPENAADGGRTAVGGLSDAHGGPTLAAQREDLLD